MRWIAAIALALAAGLSAPPARAACVADFPDAIVCLSPDAAAEAYRIVGRDATALQRDNIRAVLNRMGCARMSDAASPGKPILQFGKGRIPYLDGWVDIVAVTVEGPAGGSAVYVAKAWLKGECEPFKSVGE